MADLASLPPAQQQVILDGPALTAPPGVQSSFKNPPNANVIPEAVIPICLVLMAVAILLRTYARVFVVKRVDVDDVLDLLGFGTCIYYIHSVYQITYTVGLFVHSWNVTLRTAQEVEHVLQIAATCYGITLALVKSAILLQWLRIFAPNGIRGPFFWICHALLWCNLMFYLATLVAANLNCVPFQRIWDKTVLGVCYNGGHLNMTIAVYSLVSDICILLLPQQAIWRLNMSLKRKLGLALTFAVGLLACTVAAVRVGVTVSYITDPDWLYHVASLSMACIAEMTCIILVYNMPGVPMAFQESTFLSRVFSSLSPTLRSATRQGASKRSATDAKTSNIDTYNNHKDGHGISLDNYHQHTFEHSPSTEQLRDITPSTSHYGYVATGDYTSGTLHT